MRISFRGPLSITDYGSTIYLTFAFSPLTARFYSHIKILEELVVETVICSTTSSDKGLILLACQPP